MRFTAIALAVLATAGAVTASQCGERAIDRAACTYPSLLEVRDAVDAGSPAKIIIGMLDGVVNRLSVARDNAEASFKQADAYCKDRIAALREQTTDAGAHLGSVKADLSGALEERAAAEEQVARLEKTLAQHAAALRAAETTLAESREHDVARRREYRAARVEMEASLSSLRTMLHHVSRQPFGAQGITGSAGATGAEAHVMALRHTDALSPREQKLLRDPEQHLPGHVHDALRIAEAVSEAKESGATGTAVMEAVRKLMTSARASTTLPDDPSGLRAMHLGLTEEGCVEGVSKWCPSLGRCVVVTLNEVCPSKFGPEDADAAAERAMAAFVEVGHRVLARRVGSRAAATTAARLRALLAGAGDGGVASGGDGDAVLDAVLAAPAFPNKMFADSAAALGNAKEMAKLLRELIAHVEHAMAQDAEKETRVGDAAAHAFRRLQTAAEKHHEQHAEIAAALKKARARASAAEEAVAHARSGSSSGSAVAGHASAALATTERSCTRHTQQFAAHARAVEAELKMAIAIRRLIKEHFMALLFKTQANYDLEEAAEIEGKQSGVEVAEKEAKVAAEELHEAEAEAVAVSAEAGKPESKAEAAAVSGASHALADASKAFQSAVGATGLRGRVSSDAAAEVADLEADLEDALHGDWAPPAAPTGSAEAGVRRQEAAAAGPHGTAGPATQTRPSVFGEQRPSAEASVSEILQAGGVTGGSDELTEQIMGEVEDKAVLSFDI